MGCGDINQKPSSVINVRLGSGPKGWLSAGMAHDYVAGWVAEEGSTMGERVVGVHAGSCVGVQAGSWGAPCRRVYENTVG